MAVAVFRLVVERHPDSANASDRLGAGYLAAGDGDAARRAFEQVLETLAADPRLPDGYKPRYEIRYETRGAVDDPPTRRKGAPRVEVLPALAGECG